MTLNRLLFVTGFGLLGLFAPYQGAKAQTAVLTGRVVDVETRVPLPGASVRVLPQGIQVLSDGEGRFRIEGVNPGMVQLEATTLGYSPTIETSVMARTSRPTYVSLELRPAAIEVEGITVEADVFQVPIRARISEARPFSSRASNDVTKA